MKREVSVELYFVPGWGAAEHVRSLVSSLVEKKKIRAEVVEISVGSAEEAVALRFPGSPTVRVNGRDIEAQAEKGEDYGLGWRVYRDEEGGFVKEVPVKLIESAIEAAVGLSKAPDGEEN